MSLYQACTFHFFAVNDFLSSFALSVDEPTNSASSFEMIDGFDQNDFKEQKMNDGMCSTSYWFFYNHVNCILYCTLF